MRQMLDAARQAIDFVTDRTRDDLDSDPMLRRAVIHCIQEIGEAASQVGETTRSSVTEVPWWKIVGMRHNLVHVYFNIKNALIWQVVSSDLAPLIAELEQALSSETVLPDADDASREHS